MPRELITLACTECKGRNYQTDKNPKSPASQGKRLELKKFCKSCGRHTLHRETR